MIAGRVLAAVPVAVRRIWLVARWEFMTTVMRPAFVAALVALPLAHLGLAALIGVAIQGAVRERTDVRPVVVVDPHGLLGPAAPESRIERDVEPALAAVRERRYDAVFVLDEDYLETGRVRAFTPPTAGLLQLGRRLTQRERAASVIRRNLTADLDGARRHRVLDPIDEVTHFKIYGDVIEADPPFAVLTVLAGPFGICFVLALSIFLVSGTLLQAMSSELQNRMLEMLLVVLTPYQLLAGKTLGLAATGLIQVAVYLGIAFAFGPWFLLGRVPLPTLAWCAVVFLAGYALFAALLAGVGALARDPHETTQIASVCLLAAAAPFFFITHISDAPTSLLSRLLTWFPPTAPVSLLLRIGVDGVGLAERVLVIASIAAFGAVALQLAAFVFGARIRRPRRVSTP